MTLLIILLVAFYLINETFVYFSAVMHWQEMRDSGLIDFKRDPVLFILCHLNLVKGLILDTLLNLTVFTCIGLELPKEFLTTARLNRWYNTLPANSLGEWRMQVAGWMKVRLDKIDPSGVHIK